MPRSRLQIWALRAAESAGIALVYFLLARIGQILAIEPGNVTPIWPASGFALAVVLRVGYRAWVGLWLGNFLGNTWAFLDTSTTTDAARTIATGLAIGPGDVLQTLLGAYLIRRCCDTDRLFGQVSDVFWFVSTQSVACLLSATFGVLALSFGNIVSWQDYGHTWLTWYLGDGIGVLLVAPWLLTLRGGAWTLIRDARLCAEGLLILVLAVLTTYLAFAPTTEASLLFLPLPLVLWAAIRANQFAVSSTVLVIVGMGLWLSWEAVTEIERGEINYPLLWLQLYAALTSVTGSIVCSALTEVSTGEEALRISEERYALAVRGSMDGLWDWDLKTDQVVYSERFKELLGYADDEFPNVFESFASHLHEADADRVMAAVQVHLQQQVPYDIEYRLNTKSSGYRWFRARGQAVWDDSGAATRMAGSITDITEQKDATALLRHERFLFQTLFDHLPDAIYFKDKLGRFTRVTASLAKRLGASDPTEVVGKTDADFFPEDYADEARTDEQRLMETGQPLIGKEEQPYWGAQAECWVSTTKVPLFDELGAVVGTIGISHDITDQKLAQERFRRVIEAAPNAMIVVNSRGKIQSINTATEQLFGYSREELIGQFVELLVPGQHRAHHTSLRREYLRQPTARAMGPGRELSGQRKDGSQFPVEIGLSPIQLGGELAVLSSIYDATKRKQAEVALLSAKEAAEQANRAKSDFLANMSHEIRTPMNAIIGMTELVLETETNQTQADYLKIVLDSAESLLTIINQILDFSKIEAGRLELDSTDFNLHEEVGDTLKSLGHRAHAKQLELAWHIDNAVPRYLRGDPVRLRQVLVNLAGNAIKFTSAGEVVVDIALRSIDESAISLEFSVRDTGIGIPKEKQQHIFAAFEQADTSTTRQYGGTGLGLAISTRIIEAMNGSIWVESEPGAGSEFRFTVDFQPGSCPAEEKHVQVADLSDLSVLVVDDNETNRHILKETLENWDIRVVTAASGQQAIEDLQNEHVDGQELPVLISDVHMPEMDGFMLAEAIRSHPTLKNMVILLLTSGGRPGDTQRCERLGIKCQLMKPAKQSELLAAITTACGRTAVAVGTPDEPQQDDVSVPPLKVLLVEDGKANQILARGMLEKWGHYVDVAENGEQAIQKWQQDEFNVILMDVQMPVMDGMEATRHIRELEVQTNSHIPIIAMTAHAMKGDRERCLEVGMDDYVAKPFRKSDLYAVLSQYFSTNEQSHIETRTTSPQLHAVAKLIDWQKALDAVAGEEGILQDVAAAAQQEFPDLLKSLEQSLADQDFVTARRAAHTIKGSSRILGATEVIELSAEAEEAAASFDASRVHAAVRQLRGMIDQISQEIDTFLREKEQKH